MQSKHKCFVLERRYCKKYSQSETPFDVTLKIQTKAFGHAMRNAFGDDIGNFWELYLERRYSTDRWRGGKVRLVEDIEPSMTRIVKSGDLIIFCCYIVCVVVKF